VKVQLNLFYRLGDFDLSQMPDTYRREWAENADWLKLSFHSDCEIEDPYISSGYEEVYEDCKKVHENIIRFASPAPLAKTTTIHWCQTTEDGVRALADLGIKGLLGLFGNSQNPKTSYSIREEQAKELRRGKTLKIGEVHFAAIAMVLNNYSEEEILEKLSTMKTLPFLIDAHRGKFAAAVPLRGRGETNMGIGAVWREENDFRRQDIVAALENCAAKLSDIIAVENFG
jgi:hypothetical protein